MFAVFHIDCVHRYLQGIKSAFNFTSTLNELKHFGSVHFDLKRRKNSNVHMTKYDLHINSFGMADLDTYPLRST